MFKYLLQRKFLEILPIESSFYQRFDTIEKMALSRELLRLNYSRYAPFNDPNIAYMSDDSAIHIWFYKQRSDAWALIPEAYILFNILRDHHANAIILIHESAYKGIVIGEGKLLNAFSMSKYDEGMLSMMGDTYGIDTIIEMNEQEYRTKFAQALEQLKPSELLRWNRLVFAPKEIAKKVFEKSAYPLAAFLLLSIALDALHTSVMTSRTENLSSRYSEIKIENDPIREALREKKNETARWKKLLLEELIYPDSMFILDAIYGAIEEVPSLTLKEITISNGRMGLTAEGDENPVLLLNKLISLAYFENVRIAGSHKPGKGAQWIKYEADIKPLGENGGH